ncbi:class I SAM-dependent methyltransferase [Nisaea acidiphila]|uniref:Class I SAM-dependent methyltransferase n=1 Tax=Nisaea acidiphila TaxID=1862145 RepID=A0A9J7AQG4_9PROT|nr:class I SAM-dependent methyltransferase [Nisaea acidiphila]UUX49843.1 class I SAM-dependent methyltransferase [Nisaea acidiphila]
MSFDQSLVATFYEKHPYPYRPSGNSGDETLIGIPSDLRFINHYVFGGRRDFKKKLRLLVAGGGTGDALVGLGRQVSRLGCPAELVYVDLSSRSRQIAEERCRKLGLEGIRFHTGRIQDIAEAEPEPFDYIDFCGVINHVGEQQEVVDLLATLLAEDGGMGVMAYGQLGRTGVYHVQDMLRMSGAGHEDVKMARALLGALPETNWHRRNAIFAHTENEPDVEIADRYLNPADRAFSVSELRDIMNAAGLEIAAFVPPLLYDAATEIADRELRERIAKLAWIDRCIFAELFHGDIAMHNFYVVKAGRRPDADRLLGEKSAIPIMTSIPTGQAPTVANGRYGFSMKFGPQIRQLALPGTEHTAAIIRAIDGTKTLQQIHRTLPGNLSWRQFQREFALVYRGLNGAGEMVLSMSPIPR